MIRDDFLSFTKRVFSNPNCQISMHARKIKFALESRAIIQQNIPANSISIALFVLEQSRIKGKRSEFGVCRFLHSRHKPTSYFEARDDLLPFSSHKQCQELLWKTVPECQKCISKCCMLLDGFGKVMQHFIGG